MRVFHPALDERGDDEVVEAGVALELMVAIGTAGEGLQVRRGQLFAAPGADRVLAVEDIIAFFLFRVHKTTSWFNAFGVQFPGASEIQLVSPTATYGFSKNFNRP